MRRSGMVLLMVTAFAVSYRTEAYHNNHHQFSSSSESQTRVAQVAFLYQDHIHCVQTPQSAHTNEAPLCQGLL